MIDSQKDRPRTDLYLHVRLFLNATITTALVNYQIQKLSASLLESFVNKLRASAWVFSFIVAASLSTVSIADQTIRLISTEMSAGLLNLENNRAEGIYPDLFREAAERANVNIEFRVVPWLRAIAEAKKSHDYLLFPLTRTIERERFFSWQGLLRKDPLCFIALSGTVNSLEHAKGLKRILVWAQTSHQTFLEEQGFTNLVPISDEAQAVDVLSKRYSSAWYTSCLEDSAFPNHPDIKRAAVLGNVVAYETIWIAGGSNFKPTKESERFMVELSRLYNEGRLDELSASVK